MAYSLVNLIATLLGVAFIYNGYRLVRHGREDIFWFLISGTVGVGILVVAFYSNIFIIVADIIGLRLKGRAILVVANITLFALVAVLFSVVKNLYDRVSQMHEELVLLRHELNEDDS